MTPVHRLRATFVSEHEWLMTNLQTLDLNIEFQEAIKQRRFPVETGFNQLGRRPVFVS